MKALEIKSKGGRPSKLTARTIKKLEESFQIGATIAEACSVAKITPQTYNNWCNSDESFLLRMQQAQSYADLFAKKNIVVDITQKSSIDSSKWWLEKRQYNSKDIIGIETNDGDRTTRFIISRGSPEATKSSENLGKLAPTHTSPVETNPDYPLKDTQIDPNNPIV